MMGYLNICKVILQNVQNVNCPFDSSSGLDRTEPGETMTREFLYSDVCKAGSSENCSSVIPSDRKYLLSNSEIAP